MVVAVEITRRRELCTSSATRDREDSDLKIGDTEAARKIIGLKTLQYTTTKGSANTLPP